MEGFPKSRNALYQIDTANYNSHNKSKDKLNPLYASDAYMRQYNGIPE